jgi:endonuclease III
MTLSCIMAVLEKLLESTLGANLRVREVGFKRKQNHPLNKVLKSLTAESENAVDILVKLMTSEDTDDKTKLAAASKLLDLQRQVAADINQDELQRLIANVKFGGPRELEVDDDTPQIDFTQVIDV